jgi:hypothetical protein
MTPSSDGGYCLALFVSLADSSASRFGQRQPSNPLKTLNAGGILQDNNGLYKVSMTCPYALGQRMQVLREKKWDGLGGWTWMNLDGAFGDRYLENRIFVWYRIFGRDKCIAGLSRGNFSFQFILHSFTMDCKSYIVLVVGCTAKGVS